MGALNAANRTMAVMGGRGFVSGRMAGAVAMVLLMALGAACGGDSPDGSGEAKLELPSVSAGFAHTCGLRQDGSVLCWGWDEYGQATPPEGSSPRLAPGPATPAGCGKTAPSGVGALMDLTWPRRRRGSSPLLAPGPPMPAGCGGTAPSSAGAMIGMVKPRRRRESSLRSAPGSDTPAECYGMAPSGAGERITKAEQRRQRGSSLRSAPGSATPAGCGGTAPSGAGAVITT